MSIIRKEIQGSTLRGKSSPTPFHAFKEEDLQQLKQFIKNNETEYVYTCPHRRMKSYLIEEGITWKQIWQCHVNICSESDRRFASYDRFRQYVHHFF